MSRTAWQGHLTLLAISRRRESISIHLQIKLSILLSWQILCVFGIEFYCYATTSMMWNLPWFIFNSTNWWSGQSMDLIKISYAYNSHRGINILQLIRDLSHLLHNMSLYHLSVESCFLLIHHHLHCLKWRWWLYSPAHQHVVVSPLLFPLLSLWL